MQSLQASSERHQVSPVTFASGLIGLALAWCFVAAGETLYGDLDGATDLAAIAADGGRFAAGALLELLGAALLAGGAAAAIMRLSATSPRLASVGGWMTLASAVCVGAFAMFHLVLLAMADDVAHREALNGFLLGPLNSEPGAWGIPILWVILLLPIGFALLAIAAARSRLAPWWPVALIVGSTVLHLAGIDGTTEIASHWILAAAMAWLGVSLLRTTRRRTQLGMFTAEAT